MYTTPISVLLVEDNADDARFLSELLAATDSISFHVTHVESFAAAIALLAVQDTDVVLLDLSLPDVQDEVALERLHTEFPRLPVVVLSSIHDDEYALALLQRWVQEYLVKDAIDTRSLVRSLRFAIERNQAVVAAQLTLHESEEKFRSIVETTKEWIWATDKDGLLTYSNPALETILGYRVDDWLGKDVFEYLHPEDQQFEAAWDQRSATAQGWSGVVLRWRHKDGSYRYVESNATPILDAFGEVIGFRGSDRDITERNQSEARQREFDVERERARLFKRFVGGVSHDLRTPLTIISTSLELLRRSPVSDYQIRHLDKLEDQYERIHSIVEDLFSLLRLDGEEPEQTRRPLELSALVETVLNQNLLNAQKKNQRVRRLFTENLPMVMVDPSELTQAVTQLLVNALNYTPAGGEIILATYEQDQQAVFKIADNGIGIDAEDLPHIFERFYRADKARSGETGGSGLGLAIAKKIIESHGGQIWAESILGLGSTFYFSLPVIG